jgi:Fe2+ transport system protein FeoA
MKKRLTEFKEGDIVKIECVNCSLNFKNRLCELGLYDGSKVEIVKNDHFGPLIIKIFESKIALGRGEASKVYGQK